MSKSTRTPEQIMDELQDGLDELGDEVVVMLRKGNVTKILARGKLVGSSTTRLDSSAVEDWEHGFKILS